MLKAAVKKAVAPYRPYLMTFRMLGKAAKGAFGLYDRECTICGYKGKFLAEIHLPEVFRFDSLCPGCTSLARNRILWLKIRELALIGPSDRVLHFAPEKCLNGRIETLGATYTTADYLDPKADIKINIEAIDLPDASIDVIICSHILEHVNDGPALRELYRVLSPGGRLIALVPIAEGWSSTYENEQNLPGPQRRQHFGRADHIRRYGRDFRERLVAPGFVLDAASCSGPDCVRYALIPGECVFICRKPE